ncbi:MAG TPA: hypothetical protein ENH45_04215, partial [Nitrospirae bacterium]|nr:hypothetical protein [Nitrospirota bacterium]
MKKTDILLLIAAFTALIVSGFYGNSIAAQEEVPKEKVTCITSKCHATMKEVKYVHGPVAADECIVCHGESPKHAANPKKNKFAKIDNVQSKCFECHDPFPKKKFTHTPVEEGECIACHSPHGSPYKF